MASSKGRIVFIKKSDPVYYHSVYQPPAVHGRAYKNTPSHLSPRLTREDIDKQKKVRDELLNSIPQQTGKPSIKAADSAVDGQKIAQARDKIRGTGEQTNLEDLQDRVLGNKRHSQEIRDSIESLHEPAQEPHQEEPAGEEEILAAERGMEEDPDLPQLKSKQSEEKLENMVSSTKSCLLEIKTVFPFKVFPTKIIVDLEKVNVVETTFFYSETIRSIWIKSVLDVSLESDLFFGKIKLVDIGFRDDPIVVSWLWKEDAFRARRLIQGLIISHKQNLDLSNMPEHEVFHKLEQLGQVPNE